MDFGMAAAAMYGTDESWKLINVQKKQTKGKNPTCPVQIGTSQAHSKDFSVAQELAGVADPTVDTWVNNTDQDHAVDYISTEEMYQAPDDVGAFMQQRKFKIDNALEALSLRKIYEIWSEGNNVIGKVKTVASNKLSIVLTEVQMQNQFEKGTQVVFAASKNSGSLRAAGNSFGYNTVAKVKRSFDFKAPPTITFTSAVGSTVAVGDYIFKRGDFKQRSIFGFQSWLPHDDAIRKAGTPFFGIDRSVEQERLMGFASTVAASESIHEEVRKLVAQNAALCGKVPTRICMHPLTEDLMLGEVKNQLRYDRDGGDPGKLHFGWSQIVFNTGSGKIPTLLSPRIPLGRIYGIHWPLVKLIYKSRPGGKFVDFQLGPQGERFKVAHNRPGYETRFECFGQLFYQIPGTGFVMDISAKWA